MKLPFAFYSARWGILIAYNDVDFELHNGGTYGSHNEAYEAALEMHKSGTYDDDTHLHPILLHIIDPNDAGCAAAMFGQADIVKHAADVGIACGYDRFGLILDAFGYEIAAAAKAAGDEYIKANLGKWFPNGGALPHDPTRVYACGPLDVEDGDDIYEEIPDPDDDIYEEEDEQ